MEAVKGLLLRPLTYNKSHLKQEPEFVVPCSKNDYYRVISIQLEEEHSCHAYARDT